MSQKVAGLRKRKCEKSTAEIARHLHIYKYNFKVNYIDIKAIKCQHKYISN